MHKKDIKARVRKQLKTKVPNWHRLTRKEKREIAQKVLNAYIGMECKQNRAFIGLHLIRREMINHVQMSQFRSSLSFTQLVNLMDRYWNKEE